MVIFNNVIHELRSSIWHITLSDATGWDYWARDLPISARWSTLLLPPALGGLAVGLLRKVSGGFENPPNEPQKQQHQQSEVSTNSQTAAATPSQNPQQNSRAQPPQDAAATQTRASTLSAPDTSTSDSDADSARISSSQEASTSGSSTVWSLPWGTSGSRGLRLRLLRVMRPVLKAGAAAITLGTGNSLGPEGPSVEIGRAAARGLGTVLKSKQRRLLSLVAAGSGAGQLSNDSHCYCNSCPAPETQLMSAG